MKVIRNSLALIGLIFPALFCACSSNTPSEKQSAAVKPSVLETIDGIWVTEKYLTALKANKTPFVDKPESITFSAAEKKLAWTNFHEGFEQVITESGQDKNLYFLSVTAPQTTEPPTKKVHFSLHTDALIFLEPGVTERANERFVKINESLEQLANKLILVGKYKDSEGEFYEFTEDGKAKWPTMSFNYTFVLDPSEATCPYIITSISNGTGQPVRFGYKWVAGQLYFFDITSDDAPISCSKLPIFNLRKF